MNENKNVNFIFYSDWLDSISALDVDMQNKIIGEWARYACERPLLYKDDPIIFTMANQRFGAIDASKASYQNRVAQGKTGGKKAKIDREKAIELKQSGMYTNQEIADMLGCSKSTIDHL